MQQAAFILTFLSLLAGIAQAQDVTVTEYASTVTVAYTPTTLSTITISATQVIAQSVATSTASYGSDDGSSTDTDAGASGTQSSSFEIGQGAIIAISVVCGFVVIFGIATTILFVVAKRRQWNIRASVARASRRMTGRFGNSNPSRHNNASTARRTGTYFGVPARSGIKAVMPPGHKRGLVVDVQPVQHVEKRPDPLAGKAPANTRPREQTWLKNVWGNGWK